MLKSPRENAERGASGAVRWRLRWLLFLTTICTGAALPQASNADVTLYPGSGKLPSVIVYIRVDAGLRLDSNVDLAQYNGNKGTTTLVQAGGNDWGTSMFGVYGSAQIAPELVAVYKVESGFNATNGTFNSSTNSIFNRRAYVGLSNPKFGTIVFGKDLFIDNDIYNFDPMIQENMSTPTLVYGRNWGGASDMVEYRSPDMSGFKIAGMAVFGNGDTFNSTKVSNMYGISAEYDISKLSLYGIYDEVQDENGGFTNLYSASREGILGLKLDLNPVTLFAGYEDLSAPDGSQSKGGTPLVNPGANFTPNPEVFATSAYMTWIGAVFQATQNVVLRGAWYHTGINDHAGSANLITGGGEYSLSKNVLLYTTVGEVLNQGQAAFSADIYAPPPAPGHSQFSAFSGVSITF
jgi:predicted porin